LAENISRESPQPIIPSSPCNKGYNQGIFLGIRSRLP